MGVVLYELGFDNFLYVNDGTYGSLFDAGHLRFLFPMRVVRENVSKKLIPFELYGPTCDSLDHMKGPFLLPDDIKEGDLFLGSDCVQLLKMGKKD